MLTLGIESSCDETSSAVVEDGRRILSNLIASQVDVHRPYGGVVPSASPDGAAGHLRDKIQAATVSRPCGWTNSVAIGGI